MDWQPRRFGAWLETPVSQYLGRISYSLYLFNVIFLTLADHWTADWPSVRDHPLEMGIVIAIPVLAGGILLAHVAEKFLERPSILLAHQITAKPPVPA